MSKAAPASQTALMAPLSGELVPLESVPDPVFSQKMVGDGIAIDPLSSTLCAPCNGEIIYIHPAGHAVTLKTADGLKILIHVGIDTVKLKGQGFSPKAKKGEFATVGMPLMELDLDFLATHAKSLVTPVVITNVDKIASFERASGMTLVGTDRILSLITTEESVPETSEAAGRHVIGQELVVPNSLGLHARPAAVMANIAKKFRSDIRIHYGEKTANAKSITSMMALDIVHESKLSISAQGPDAPEAVAKLSEWLEKGLGDFGFRPAPAPASVAGSTGFASMGSSQSPHVMVGVPCSPGIGAGGIFRIRHGEVRVVEMADDPDHERELLLEAIERSMAQIAVLRARFRSGGDLERAAIFAAHSEMVEDPALLDFAISAIAKGKSAAFAWKAAYEKAADALEMLPNPGLAQRAIDLRDAGGRVLDLLSGVEPRKWQFPKHAVLVAEDMGPSIADSIDENTSVEGICTTRGGPSSHLSAIARSFGIPAIAGIDPRILEVHNRTLVTVDATRGMVHLNAPPPKVKQILEAKATSRKNYKSHLAHASESAVTVDGHRVEVLAEIAAVESAKRMEKMGGQGVGLLHTEFLFVNRGSPPTEEEQFEAYKTIVDSIGPERQLCIRCFDVGVEQSIPYLPIPAEGVPLLGERGIRIGLDRPDLLRTQFRAILRASVRSRIRILLPLVSMIREVQAAKCLLEEEAASLGVATVPVGVAVEIPATAIMSAQFAREADFICIATNNLAQYAFGMDRGHPKLSPNLDALHPGVLRLIARSAAGAHARGITVAVCGGIAADAHAVPILVGLGIGELGVKLPAIPTVKAQIRSLDFTTCRELAQRTLDCENAAEVRALSANWDQSTSAAVR